jgi:hypothetical protein
MIWGQGPGLDSISPHLSRRDVNDIFWMVEWLRCGTLKKALVNK